LFVDAAWHNADLGLAWEITPGQLGPMSRDLDLLTTLHTLTMSLVGIPSVMQMIRGSRRLPPPEWHRRQTRRHEDHGGIGPGLFYRLGYGVKYRQPSCVEPPCLE